MPVSVVCGAPGAGKSYYTCLEIKEALEKNRHVYTNLVLLPEFIEKHKDFLHVVSDLDISTFWRKLPKNALFVVDEALIYYPKDYLYGPQNKKEYNEFKNWIALHRHQGQDVIFVVQSHFLLSSLVKAMADVRIQIHNKSHLGFKSFYVLERYSPFFSKAPYSTQKGKYKTEVFAMYQSIDDGANLATKKGKNIFTSFWLAGSIIAFVVGSYFVYSLIHRYSTNSVRLNPKVVAASSQKTIDKNSPKTMLPTSSASFSSPAFLSPPLVSKEYPEFIGIFNNQLVILKYHGVEKILPFGSEFLKCKYFLNYNRKSSVIRKCGKDEDILILSLS